MGQKLVLEASSAKAATGNSLGIAFDNFPNYVCFELDLTAAAVGAGDTLDAFVQTKVGDNWVDVVHFAQMLGNGGAKRFFAKVVGDLAQAEFENASALAAAAVRHILGSEYRVRWTIAGAGPPSFTFSVTAQSDSE